MPGLKSFQGLTPTLPSLFQAGGGNVFSNGRLQLEFLVREMRSILLHGYNGVQHTTSYYIPHAATSTAAPEFIDLESQHCNYQPVTNIGQGPVVTTLHPFRNVNSHSTSDHIVTSDPTSEADDSATESDQPTDHQDHDSLEKTRTRPERTPIWKVSFVVGVVSLIVVPGLVVGVMTRQMSWGFELSGAIAPIVSLLAGLYYHTKK